MRQSKQVLEEDQGPILDVFERNARVRRRKGTHRAHERRRNAAQFVGQRAERGARQSRATRGNGRSTTFVQETNRVFKRLYRLEHRVV
jgi:hypothetical protein